MSLGNGFDDDRRWHDGFGDDNNWEQPEYWRTIELGDVNGDGLADLCGRHHGGVYCTRSYHSLFDANLERVVPDFGDAQGWSAVQYSRRRRRHHGDRTDVARFR